VVGGPLSIFPTGADRGELDGGCTPGRKQAEKPQDTIELLAVVGRFGFAGIGGVDVFAIHLDSVADIADRDLHIRPLGVARSAIYLAGLAVAVFRRAAASELRPKACQQASVFVEPTPQPYLGCFWPSAFS